ncbi:MAG: AEC family transporter [bacterium]|nr:AEC family transporter [bacterium]
MYSAFVPLILILAAGVCFRFIPGIPPAADIRRVIGSIVLNVFLPALTFIALYRAPLNTTFWTVPLTSVVVTLVGLAAAYLFYVRFLHRLKPSHRLLTKPAIGSLLLASAFCNATYLGLPIVTSVIGPHVQQVPILFDLLAMTPILFVAATFIGVEYGNGVNGQRVGLDQGTQRQNHSIGSALVQLLRLPPLWAAAAGIALNAGHVVVPLELTATFETLGRTVSPLMMFSVGLALRIPNPKRIPYIVPAVFIRLVCGALVGWFIASRIITDADIFKATVLESAMPTMMLTMVFADRYGLDTELLADAIILSTVCAMITLPLLAHWL